LLYLGFSDPGTPLSESLAFWREFAGLFTEKVLKTPELENLYEPFHIPVVIEEINRLLLRTPLMTGTDYLDTDLLHRLWTELNADFTAAFMSQDGSVADFIRTYRPKAHLVGRVFFHLVENKDGEAPFAFLATYSTRLNIEGKSKHLPLKIALREYEGQKNKLLKLLSTVYRAAEASKFLADLLEPGDIFHPLSWSPGKAFRFLKDIPVFEKDRPQITGLMITTWWSQPMHWPPTCQKCR
jgi:non-specific serine/threonine protein kinase